MYRRAALRKWKEKQGYLATYDKLLKICCEASATSVVKAICETLESRVQTSGGNEGVEEDDFSGELDMYHYSA